MTRSSRCLKERELLLLLDREASPRLQNHFDGCENCRANLAQVQRRLKAIGQVLRSEPPPEFARRDFQPFGIRWSRLAAGLAVVLVVVSGGLSLWNSSLPFRPKENISPETQSILKQFPSNPFLLSEAIAKELGIEESDYLDAAADWETNKLRD